MTFETAGRAIDFIASVAAPQCLVSFIGGEPLLEFELLCRTVDYAQANYGERFSFRLSTNGTFLTPDMLDCLADKKIRLGISIDGTQQQHDANRVYSHGGGSWRNVVDNLPDIFRAMPDVPALSVVTPETVEMMADGVIGLYDLGFRHVWQSLDYSRKWSAARIGILRQQYLKLAEYYYGRALLGDAIYYSDFDDRIGSWCCESNRPGHACGIANTEIVIAASGRIYPCVQFVGIDDGSNCEYCLGDVMKGFDEQKRLRVIEESLARRKDCEGCDLQQRCSNRCGCLNWKTTGLLNEVPAMLCEHERMILPIVDDIAARIRKAD